MFLNPSDYDFCRTLEAHWQGIRAECSALPETSFDPWVQRRMHGKGWSIYALHALGSSIEEAYSLCPETAQALAQIPGLTLAGFSRLAPGAHVKPHVGWAKSVFRLHLGLIIPSDCRLRVGSESRHWQEGRCLIFDDTVEHEAWNGSDETRTVLLLDFLRPGCTEDKDDVPEEVQAYAKHLQAQKLGGVQP